jgi:hypothetical protein
MKKTVTILAVVIPLLVGCSDSLVNPVSPNKTNDAQKSWITLPENPGIGVESFYSASKEIEGDTGGSVGLEINYVTKASVNIIITASIDVPPGAYSGEKNITMIINSTNGTATFYPSPETFNKPLVFNLRVSGVDLNGVDPKSINYVYLAPDGSFEPIEYSNMVINSGTLAVKDALIPHFSVYGWCR